MFLRNNGYSEVDIGLSFQLTAARAETIMRAPKLLLFAFHGQMIKSKFNADVIKEHCQNQGRDSAFDHAGKKKTRKE